MERIWHPSPLDQPGQFEEEHEQEQANIHLVISLAWIMISVASVFLFIRLFGKYHTKNWFWWDDHVLIISWFAMVGAGISSTVSTTKGIGTHIWNVPPGDVGEIHLVLLCTSTCVVVAASLSKTSWALTLLRLVSNRTKKLVWFIIISTNIFLGIGAIIPWVRCTPPSKAWMPLRAGRCFPISTAASYGIFATVYSAAMDMLLALLPWRLLWGLPIRKREKFGACIAMSMGVFAGATSVVKAVKLTTIYSGDFTYDTVSLDIWSIAESAVTITAASLPVVRTLCQQVNTRVSSKIRESYSRRWSHATKDTAETQTIEMSRNKLSIVVSPNPCILPEIRRQDSFSVEDFEMQYKYEFGLHDSTTGLTGRSDSSATLGVEGLEAGLERPRTIHFEEA